MMVPKHTQLCMIVLLLDYARGEAVSNDTEENNDSDASNETFSCYQCTTMKQLVRVEGVVYESLDICDPESEEQLALLPVKPCTPSKKKSSQNKPKSDPEELDLMLLVYKLLEGSLQLPQAVSQLKMRQDVHQGHLAQFESFCGKIEVEYDDEAHIIRGCLPPSVNNKSVCQQLIEGEEDDRFNVTNCRICTTSLCNSGHCIYAALWFICISLFLTRVSPFVLSCKDVSNV